MLLESYKSHFKKTFLLAYPVVISQVGHVIVNLTDSVLIGHLGPVKLAACSLGISVFAVLMVVGIGIAYGLTPHISREFGAKNKDECGKFLVNSFLINIITGFLIYAGIYLLSTQLDHMGQEPEVVKEALPFLRIIGFSMVPLMLFLTFKQFAEGLNFTRQAMIITLIADGINIFLTYGLINGEFGLPRLELRGAGIANLLSRTLMAILMIAYVLRSKNFKPYLHQAKVKFIKWKDSLAIINYGIPTAFQYLFEVGAFALAALMMGMISANHQSAHQIAISIASATYMAASGIGAATSVRVGNALGEKNYTNLRRAGFSGYWMALIFMGLSAFLMIFGREAFPKFYMIHPEVNGIASVLMINAAFFQLSDGTQVVGLGALRGMGDVKIPTLITFIAYWIIAIPLSYYLGFTLEMGAEGIWIALSLGLTISAVLLFWRFRVLSAKLLKQSELAIN
jgi:MATE family multidrug resistance protein